MFGISYGELFLLVGATAALVGPKDLPVIARTAGRLAGRAIGYVQLARGQFDNIMQQSQARQVQKDLQDAMQQLEAIRFEIRSVSLMNPGPMTRKFMDGPQERTPNNNGSSEKVEQEQKPTNTVAKEYSPKSSGSTSIHSQATAYARLAESQSMKASGDEEYMNSEAGLFTILPVSAESTGMLPKRKENAQGSDILLEAVVEAEVANNAKDFFSQPQNQIQ